MAYAKTSERREKRLLREQMRSLGLGYRDIAAEFARRYRLRPRAAWREAYGWSLQDTADRINEFRGNTGLDPGGIASMTAPHLSEYENWPGHGPEPAGRRPSPYLLAILAAVYDCAVTDLVDLADREHLRPADLLILDKYSQPAAQAASGRGQAPVNHQGILPEQQGTLLPEPGEHPVGAQAGFDPDSQGMSRSELPTAPPAWAWPAVISAPAVVPQPSASAVTENAIWAVAAESASHASAEAARSVAPLGVIQLTAELQRLARSYSAMPPLEFLGQARSLRDESRRLSERTRKPAQLADLHLVTGGACALLAMASWDLGAWSAAIEQAHAATVYGEITGHGGLQAWAFGLEGLIVFWRGRPREAAAVIAGALEVAPRGTARARLHCIAARAWAHLGAEDRVSSELAAADRAQEESGGAYAEELHDEVGGEYGWDKARHAMCAATALLTVGDPDGAAVRAREAIALHAAGYAFGDTVGAKAQADLACVELSRGRLDAAGDALSPVWGVVPGFRSYPLVGRLESAAAALGARRYAGSMPAADLAERIRVFSAESAPVLAARGMLPPGGQ
jgi:hypothetical protein